MSFVWTLVYSLVPQLEGYHLVPQPQYLVEEARTEEHLEMILTIAVPMLLGVFGWQTSATSFWLLLQQTTGYSAAWNLDYALSLIQCLSQS